MSKRVKRIVLMIVLLGICTGILYAVLARPWRIPTKNVFDEIFFVGKNELDISYLWEKYEVYFLDKDGDIAWMQEIKSSMTVLDREGGKDVYIVRIDEYEDGTMEIFTVVKAEGPIALGYTYQYDVREKTLQAHIRVSDRERKYDIDDEALKSKAKAILDEFIREFIRNNEGKTMFTPEDWGEYEVLEESLNIIRSD